LVLQGSNSRVPIEGYETTANSNQKIMYLCNRRGGHRADQNVAHNAADNRHNERQKKNAEQVEPFLHALKTERWDDIG
jgi:hypothetical protein